MNKLDEGDVSKGDEINLDNTNRSEMNLSEMNLSEMNLSEMNLSEMNLNETNSNNITKDEINLDENYDYYRGYKWFCFDDKRINSRGEEILKVIIACRCYKISIENGKIKSERNIILIFEDWTIPERISAHSSIILRNKKGKPVETIHILKKYIDENDIKYVKDQSKYIRCRNIYKYVNYTKKRGDKLFLIRFESISDYRSFSKVMLKSDTRLPREIEFTALNDSKYNITVELNDSYPNVKFTDRFLSEKNIRSSDWFKINKSNKIKSPYNMKSAQSYLYKHDYIENINSDELSLLENEEIECLICSMDLECHSNSHNFPNPVILEDPIVQISALFKSYKSDKINKYYLITWLPTRSGKYINVSPKSESNSKEETNHEEINHEEINHDKLNENREINSEENSEELIEFELIIVNDERECIIKYFELLQQYSPDIIVGHNIYGFDNPYIFKRCKLLNIDSRSSEQFYPPLSNRIPHTSFGGKFGKVDYFDFSYCYLDTQNIFTNKYKGSLSSFSLDNIALTFLKYGKDDVTAKDMFNNFGEMIEIIKVYNLIQSTKSKITSQFYSYLSEKYKRVKDRNLTIAKYCVRDSLLVLRLFESQNLLEELFEISIINNVDIICLYSRGEQIRAVNGLYRTAFDPEYSNSKLQNYISNITIRKYMKVFKYVGYFGAKVLDSIPGFHDLVFTSDFMSMYPNIINEYNLCYSTFLDKDEIDRLDLRKEDVTHLQLELKNRVIDESEVPPDFIFIKKKKPNTDYIGYYLTTEDKYFVKSNIMRGILPNILKSLLFRRYEIKALLKKLDSNSTAYALNNSKQLGLKISANSIYGFTGVSPNGGGKIPCTYVSAAVTNIGQRMIQIAKEFSESEFNVTVIYGDTDSVMFKPNEYEYRDATYIQAVQIWPNQYNYLSEEEYSQIENKPQIIWIHIINSTSHYYEDKFYKSGLDKWMDVFEFRRYIDLRYDEVFKPPSKLEFEEMSSMLITENKKCYIKLFLINDEGYISPNMKPTLTSEGLISLNKNHAKKSGVISKKRDTTKWTASIFDTCIIKIMSHLSLQDIISYYISELDKLYLGNYSIPDFSYNIKIKTKDYNPRTAPWYILRGLKQRGYNLDELLSNRCDFVVINDGSSSGAALRTYLLEEAEQNKYVPDFQKEMDKLETQLNKFIYISYSDQIDSLISNIKKKIIKDTTLKLKDIFLTKFSRKQIYNIIRRDIDDKSLLMNQKYKELRIKPYKTEVKSIITNSLNKPINYISDSNILYIINKIYVNKDNKDNEVANYIKSLLSKYIQI